MSLNPRWVQRFSNFEKAVLLLSEIQSLKLKTLSVLEKEGIIQRFEYTLELAWKTLKDKMEFDGLIVDKVSPKMVFKEAYHAKYINNGSFWIEMINSRNLVSNTYDLKVFEQLIPQIQQTYIPELLALYHSFKREVS